MTKEVIKDVCNKYGVIAEKISDVIDTSHGENDIRYNYIINQAYVLKMNTSNMVTEGFLQGIDRTVKKYRNIGVWCPQLFLNMAGNLLYIFEQDKKLYRCYFEEYALHEIADGKVEEYDLKEEMLQHLGKLAAEYTNVDLVDTYSMWSLIDLAPLDQEVEFDEKQENLNSLIDILVEHGNFSEAEKLKKLNMCARNHIKTCYDFLPRCVYQGDLNSSNVLLDVNHHFIGIIDFNMYGTEVNINCFLNESMYFLEEQDFKELTATEIFEKMYTVQQRLLNSIFKYYTLNRIEREVYRDYKRIIDISFYPNVMLWKKLIRSDKYEKKVIQLINILSET